jgi:hypothetical protein
VQEIAWWLAQVARPPGPGEPASVGQRLIRVMLPPNWLDLPHALIPRAQRRMRDSGICLAWVPRPTAIRAVVAAKHIEDAHRALVDHRREIIDDCARQVAQVRTPELGMLPVACGEAVASAGATTSSQRKLYAARSSARFLSSISAPKSSPMPERSSRR